VDIFTGEGRAGWASCGLVTRGSGGVPPVVSGSHRGLLGSAAGVHFLRNLLTRLPKSAQTMAATLIRSIFAQPDEDEMLAQHRRLVKKLSGRFPEAATMPAEASEEVLAFASLPTEHWRQIWSNIPQERLNREIRRPTDMVGICPNRQAILRRAATILLEKKDEWAVARRPLGVESLTASRGDLGTAATMPVLAEAC
jgi:putative transposase